MADDISEGDKGLIDTFVVDADTPEGTWICVTHETVRNVTGALFLLYRYRKLQDGVDMRVWEAKVGRTKAISKRKAVDINTPARAVRPRIDQRQPTENPSTPLFSRTKKMPSTPPSPSMSFLARLQGGGSSEAPLDVDALQLIGSSPEPVQHFPGHSRPQDRIIDDESPPGSPSPFITQNYGPRMASSLPLTTTEPDYGLSQVLPTHQSTLPTASTSRAPTAYRDAVPTAPQENKFPLTYVCDMANGFDRVKNCLHGRNITDKFFHGFPMCEKFTRSTYYDSLNLWRSIGQERQEELIGYGRTREGLWKHVVQEGSTKGRNRSRDY